MKCMWMCLVNPHQCFLEVCHFYFLTTKSTLLRPTGAYIYIYIYIIFFFPRMASSLEVAILRNYFLYSSILSDFLPTVKWQLLGHSAHVLGTRGRAKGKRHMETESFLFTVKTLAFPETPGHRIPVMPSRAVPVSGLHVLHGSVGSQGI